eukprot:gene21193-28095_t
MDLDHKPSTELRSLESAELPLSPQWSGTGTKFSFGRNSGLFNSSSSSSAKPTWDSAAPNSSAPRMDKWVGASSVAAAAVDGKAAGRWREDDRPRWSGAAATDRAASEVLVKGGPATGAPTPFPSATLPSSVSMEALAAGRGPPRVSAPGAPVGERWEAPGGILLEETKSSNDSRGLRYSHAQLQLQAINRDLLEAHNGELPIPPAATIEYLELLPSEPLPEPPADGSHYQGQYHYHYSRTTSLVEPPPPQVPSPTFNADRASRWTASSSNSNSFSNGRAEMARSSALGGSGVGLNLMPRSASLGPAQTANPAGGGGDRGPGAVTPPPQPPQPPLPHVSAAAFLADQWIYQDPQSVVQGPFGKVDILEWFDAGFFPAELPIKSAVDPADSPFIPLGAMLKMWAHIVESGLQSLRDALQGTHLQKDSTPPPVPPQASMPPSHASMAPAQPSMAPVPPQTSATNMTGFEAVSSSSPLPRTPNPSMSQAAGLSSSGPSGGPAPLANNPWGGPLPAPSQGSGSSVGWGAAAYPDGPAESKAPSLFEQPSQPQAVGQQLPTGLWGSNDSLASLPPQPQVAAGASAWGASNKALPPQARQAGGRALSDIQREQAQEEWPTAPPPATEQAARAVPQASKGLAGLSGPLQQLFSAAQQKASQNAGNANFTFPPPETLSPPGEWSDSKKKKATKGGEAPSPAPQPPQPSAYQPLPYQPLHHDGQVLQDAAFLAELAPPRAAPWAGVAVKRTKTMKEIQEEEAVRAATLQAQQQAAAAAAAAESSYLGSGWTKVGPSAPASNPAPTVWGTAPPAASVAAAPPLKNILQEEQMKPKARTDAFQPPLQRGYALGDILYTKLDVSAAQPKAPAAPKSAAWVPTAPKPTNLREIMYMEESAADLEGGALDEDLSDLLPPQKQSGGWGGAAVTNAPPAKSLREIQAQEARSRPAQAPVAAATDDDMFWDYGGSVPAPPTPPSSFLPSQPKAAQATTRAPITAAAIAARNLPAQQAAPPPRPPAAGGASKSPWAAQNAVKAPTGASVFVAPARPQAQAKAAPTPAAPSPAPPARDGDVLPKVGDIVMSSEFTTWCNGEMLRFFGSSDLTLIKFLLDTVSRSEVADYCQAYMGDKPADYWQAYMGDKPGASTFVAEFLKRRDADACRSTSSSKKKKKAAASAAAASSSPANWSPEESSAEPGRGQIKQATGNKAHDGKKLIELIVAAPLCCILFPPRFFEIKAQSQFLGDSQAPSKGGKFEKASCCEKQQQVFSVNLQVNSQSASASPQASVKMLNELEYLDRVNEKAVDRDGEDEEEEEEPEIEGEEEVDEEGGAEDAPGEGEDDEDEDDDEGGPVEYAGLVGEDPLDDEDADEYEDEGEDDDEDELEYDEDEDDGDEGEEPASDKKRKREEGDEAAPTAEAEEEEEEDDERLAFIIAASAIFGVFAVLHMHTQKEAHHDLELVNWTEVLTRSASRWHMQNKTDIPAIAQAELEQQQLVEWFEATILGRPFDNLNFPLYPGVQLCPYFINHHFKVIYVKSPKTGSTSILSLPPFKGQCKDEATSEDKQYCYLPVLKKEISPEIWMDYFVFAVARNPWERAVSMYHYLLAMRHPTRLPEARANLKWWSLQDTLFGACAKPTFLEFCRNPAIIALQGRLLGCGFGLHHDWHHVEPAAPCCTSRSGGLALDFTI